MPCRMLCNDVQLEGVKLSSDLAPGLFCYIPLHKIWYGILLGPGSGGCQGASLNACARQNAYCTLTMVDLSLFGVSIYMF